MNGEGFYDHPLKQPSARAQRCSEAFNRHLAEHGMEAVGRWIAIRLSDGGSDGNLYDNKAEAIRFQLHEKQCAYAQLLPEGMSPRAAESFLMVSEKFYDAGMNLADPDRMVEIPQRRETWSQHGLR